MNHSYPLYTAEAQCQDCFRCVRGCPVKAIRVADSHASVIPELCIACGHCVEVCPAKAKKIRDDLGRTQQLLERDSLVYASLAPSWVSEFRGLPANRMIAALRRLGFAGVSETAIGAEIVSSEVARSLRENRGELVISSACPVAVDYIRKYLPDFAPAISPVLSPALAHARRIQKMRGPLAKVVFIGPCIAKKNEADTHPELISTAILYPDLRQWFEQSQIDPWKLDVTDEDRFLLEEAREGCLYPIEGGMNETIRAHGGCEKVDFVTISGVHALRQALEGFSPREIREPVFIEALACVGGCVHGPGTAHRSPGLLERLRIIRSTRWDGRASERPPCDIAETYESATALTEPVSLQEIRRTLRTIGKTGADDEMNCGGCGYDTCRNFAAALIAGKAESSMCVSWLRQLAQKKSNAILRCIPGAVVIVDASLNLIECNRRFAEFSGEEALATFDAVPGMAGAALQKLVPFADLFEDVLSSGRESRHDMIRLGDRLISVNLFNIDPQQVVGAIMFDVTSTEFRREQIASRAREVIVRNLSTVQDIACMLGEHMAETEILLRSIAEDYADS